MIHVARACRRNPWDRPPSTNSVIRILFKDERDAGRFLTECRQRGLDARPEERRPVGTVKRVGPEPAVWPDAHPGRRHIGVAADRKATNAADGRSAADDAADSKTTNTRRRPSARTTNGMCTRAI